MGELGILLMVKLMAVCNTFVYFGGALLDSFV